MEHGQNFTAENEKDLEELMSMLNFYLEPDDSDEKIGIEIGKLILTADLTLKNPDYRNVEFFPDFMWTGVVKMDGKEMRMYVEGSYYVENMMY